MNEFKLIQEVFAKQAKQNVLESSSVTHPAKPISKATPTPNKTLQAKTICGIGDDAAVQQPPPNSQLVSCTDTLIAGRHFPINTSAYAIGYKAVAVNLSDIAAMGACPSGILLALSLPQTLKENHKWLQDFAKGLFACCQQYNVELIGGDTTKSNQLTITISALGFAQQCVYRHTAQLNDHILVTGTVGDAAFALEQVLADLPCPIKHKLDTPKPQVELGMWLNHNDLVNSMIDISDGLYQDLSHICKNSQVSAQLFLDKLPCHPLLNQQPIDNKFQQQLCGGDDYQLLLTCSDDQLNQIQQSKYQSEFTVIGKIAQNMQDDITCLKKQDWISLLHNGQPFEFEHGFSLQGYQHFH